MQEAEEEEGSGIGAMSIICLPLSSSSSLSSGAMGLVLAGRLSGRVEGDGEGRGRRGSACVYVCVYSIGRLASDRMKVHQRHHRSQQPRTSQKLMSGVAAGSNDDGPPLSS